MGDDKPSGFYFQSSINHIPSIIPFLKILVTLFIYSLCDEIDNYDYKDNDANNC
ncbi:MAG: hypothetical protein ABII90_07440 [Bacteroidota bacterium]